jgi:adenosine deaminase
VLQDFLEDGVVYLELRTIPRASPGISREQYVNTVLDTFEKFRAKTEQMSVFLILAIDRGSMTEAEADEIVNLAIESKSRGVVGVDICGDPTRGDVSIYKKPFSKAKQNGLGITLHFAETEASGSPNELSTLLSFQPDRLGHVIHVPDDIKKEIARRRICLELCISCNVHAKMFDGGFLDHHFGYWRHEDCPIALCVSCSNWDGVLVILSDPWFFSQTDDVGFFCSHVSNEYLLAAQHFGLSRTDLLNMCLNSADTIFAGEYYKRHVRSKLERFATHSISE